jgi:hypothetical protein
MAKVLFDIASTEESTDWQRCHLVMEVGQHIFSYAILNGNKQVMRIRSYELDALNNRDLADMLDEIITADDVLKEAMKEKVVLYNFPESHLVPDNYFHMDISRDMIELLHGDLNKGVILSEKIHGWNQYNLFRVPLDIHNLFQRRFNNGKYWHYYSLWMECWQKQTVMNNDYVSVVFYPNRVLVAVISNKQLQLLQSFSYEAAEDISYHLLNVFVQLSLSPEEVPVKLAGMIDASSTVHTEILKYFNHAELEAFPAASSSPALQEYPSHFFSPLLKLAICVS